MSNPSNLYAEKIFSEHPLVLWALDDEADYISLISEQQRDIESQWVVNGGTAEGSDFRPKHQLKWVARSTKIRAYLKPPTDMQSPKAMLR